MSELISKQLANEEISKYLKNINDASSAFAGIASADSKKYFTASAKSFIFEKTDILALWDMNPTADALKVYNASHPDGTATMVLVACKTNASNSEIKKDVSNTNLINGDQSAAVQYPVACSINTSLNFDILTDNG
jgi:hypothetical protein